MAAAVISLRARDGHELDALEALPNGLARGGIILLQEIFGLTANVRAVCEGFAQHGYRVVAPALFDRVGKGIVLGYTKDDAAKGRAYRAQIPWEHQLADVMAAFAHLGHAGRIATIGYCWGGTVSWCSAAQVPALAAAVCYYPTQIAGVVGETPRCPVLMHFGERDPIATVENAEKLMAAGHQRLRIEFYPASHGFNCNDIDNFDPPSASLALQRTLEFLNAHVG